MKKKTKIIIITILSFVLTLILGIAGIAYYEYYGQYSEIITLTGHIKDDAFDCLYPTIKDSKYGYGTTPENPYVIDNVGRLENLIKLNNSGKLQKAKEDNGIDKYYFCLQFDAEDVSQILDLSNEGAFSSIGTNEYPFVDELSGVVYAYEISTNNYVYYSGCLPEVKTYTLTNAVSQASGTYSASATYYSLATGTDYQKVTVTSETFDSLKANLYTATSAASSTTYYYASKTYDSSKFVTTSASAALNSVVFTDTASYIPSTSLTPVHQIIANETIEADLSQVDVGFISAIGDGGYAHDLILYNETIKCEEEESKGLFESLREIILSLTHNHNYEDSHDERHIGLFTGHILDGGNAYNISVGGTSDIEINTESVNYFSNYTTVGYIEDNALIGGKAFDEVATDSLLDGDCAGVLFADNIYALTTNTQDSGSSSLLTSIEKDSATGWPGTAGTSFSYGSFTFLLSTTNDTVSSIWNGTKSFLGDSSKNVYSYSLYCADEYRYSPDKQSGSSFEKSAASLKETTYDGITSLENSGNVIDVGKYIIVAHVGNEYYALKMRAQSDGTNTSYYFDTTSDCNVTDFLSDTGSLYQSCLWDVTTASTTPTFENSRFEGKYLTVSGTDPAYTTSSDSALAFGADISNSLFYYDDTTGATNTRYYLNFDATDNSFFFSESSNTKIELYQISSGYDIAEVTSYAGITENGQYLLAAYYNSNYYLLGISADENGVYNAFATDVLLSDVTSYSDSFSTTMTVTQYTTYSNYIWRANKTGTTVSFLDKLSSSYYLSNDGTKLTLSTTQVSWDYNGYSTRTSLDYNNYYLTSSYSTSPSNNTCFTVTNTAGYNIVILGITAEDETPPYISYDGAKYVDAKSSTITCGEYVIVSSDSYAIGLSGTSVAASVIDVDNYSLGDSYVWSITDGDNATTSSLLLKNKTTGTYLTSSLTGSSTETTWYYDAINKYVYYIANNVTYYLCHNTTSGFYTSTTAGTNMSLYQYQSQYTYENMTRLTSDEGFYNNTTKIFFFSTLNLYDTTQASYLVGTDASTTVDSYNTMDVQYFSMQGKYSVTAPTSGTESASLFNLVTTEDLSYFRWKLAGYTKSNSTYFSVVYNEGYGKDSSNKFKFLTASAGAGNRLLRVYYYGTVNCYNGLTNTYNLYSGGSSDSSTSKPMNSFNWSENTARQTFSLRGGSNKYGMYLSDDKKGVQLQNANSGYTPIYFYSADDVVTTYILSLVSSNGDTLEENIHYVLAASDYSEVSPYSLGLYTSLNTKATSTMTFNGSTRYYTDSKATVTATASGLGLYTKSASVYTLSTSTATTIPSGTYYEKKYYSMTYDADNQSAGIYGTNMTDQIRLIVSQGSEGYNILTTVPSDCDFEQVSINYELCFKHYNSSSTSSYNYLDFSNASNHYITNQASTSSYTNITSMYYDIINKRLYYLSGTTRYYITYASDTNAFGTVAVAQNSNGTYTVPTSAASIEMIRYTPSYKVEIITDLTSEDLNSGQYVIAGHSIDGYTALGTGVETTDITAYLSNHLSEADYNAIQEYIWNQVYYDVYGTDAVSSSNVNFMFSNAETATGFIAYKPSSGNATFEGYSSASKWLLTLSGGVWTFYCNVGIGTNYYMKFTESGASSSLTMSDTYGKVGSYISGTNTVVSDSDSGVQVELYKYADSAYTLASSIEAGCKYAVFVKSGSYFYLLSFNGNTYTATQVGKNTNNVATKITEAKVSNYLLTAASSTYGYTLKFDGTSYYLYTDGSTLSASTSSSTWDYYYNGTYTIKSRLYTISSATISGQKLDVSGSKVITSSSTSTYLYTVSGSAGSYELGSIATSVSTGSKYAIVIFKSGLYYIVSNDGVGGVTYEACNGSLPSSLSDSEVWSVSSSSGYHFYQAVDSSTNNYIIIGADSSLTLSTSYGDSSFSYSGSSGSTASYSYSSTSPSSSSVYLFKVLKNDELDSSSDITVTLNGHSKVSASIAVNQTGKYIIAAVYDNTGYILSMEDYSTAKTLDVSTSITGALDGDSISVFKASVFEQLGTDYSLVFNSLAFSGSSYYLLDGRKESQVDSKPVISEYSLQQNGITYYSIEYATIEEYAEGTDYYTYADNVFTLDATVTSSTFSDKTRYVLDITELEDDEDFESGITYYTHDNSLSTYTKVNYETDTTILNTVKGESDYIWNLYKYAITGGTSYVIGYYSTSLDKTYYLYFDTTSYEIKLTEDLDTAKTYQVQMYLLGDEAESQSSYQTFNIELEEDGVTIASFPLTETDASSIKKYTSTSSTSEEAESGKTVSGIIPGEYMIAVKDNDSYYALTLSSSSECAMSYADVSLYFGGTFERDTNGYYCISINTKYLWKQNADDFTYSNGTVSGLNLSNYAYNINLCYSGNVTTDVSYDGTHLFLENGSTTYYLKFTKGTGYSWTTDSSTASTVILYSVGAIAQAHSGDAATNYTFYSTSIDKIDYTNFSFSEKKISELQNYANAFGIYEYTTGWLVNSTTTLTDVHDSIYFASGITYNEDLAEFAKQFTSVEYVYDVDNGLSTTTNSLTYYAPKGTASFAVAEASDDDPVYVNVMVSTQLEASLDESILRYLALYKMASIDYETNTLTTYSSYDSSTISKEAFAKTLQDYRYIPYAAIPLPNCQDTSDSTSSADYVRVGDESYQLSSIGYDHLVSHTFVITEPGVYYMGSTYGSVAFTYLSIDKMNASETSESSSTSISEDFTIDICFGSVAETSTSSFAEINLNLTDASALDANVSSLAYVGRTDSDDSKTWTHSNIYTEFITGTAGLDDPASGTSYYTLALSEVDSSRITAFSDDVTYYTKSGDSYTAVDQLTTSFDATVEYYTKSGDVYTMVNAVPASGTTYYYVTLTPEGTVTLTPQIGGTEITYFMSTRTYYAVTANSVSVTSFDAKKEYYTVSGGIYTLAYDPTDYLKVTLSRSYDATSTSTLSVNYYTVDGIYNFGYGVMYINANKNSLRSYRKVSFTYHELDEETSFFSN